MADQGVGTDSIQMANHHVQAVVDMMDESCQYSQQVSAHVIPEAEPMHQTEEMKAVEEVKISKRKPRKTKKKASKKDDEELRFAAWESGKDFETLPKRTSRSRHSSANETKEANKENFHMQEPTQKAAEKSPRKPALKDLSVKRQSTDKSVTFTEPFEEVKNQKKPRT